MFCLWFVFSSKCWISLFSFWLSSRRTVSYWFYRHFLICILFFNTNKSFSKFPFCSSDVIHCKIFDFLPVVNKRTRPSKKETKIPSNKISNTRIAPYRLQLDILYMWLGASVKQRNGRYPLSCNIACLEKFNVFSRFFFLLLKSTCWQKKRSDFLIKLRLFLHSVMKFTNHFIVAGSIG